MTIFFRLLLISFVTFILPCQASQNSSEKKIAYWQSQTVTEAHRKGVEEKKAPVFSEKKDVLGHIFKKDIGHFERDTPENRQYILSAVSSPLNRMGVNAYNVEMYSQMMPDGAQAWAFVRNGIITSGGRNLYPQKWVINPDLPLGGETVPVKYSAHSRTENEFKIGLVFNKLVQVYNSYHPRTALSTRDIRKELSKGVENQTGVILNMFEDSESSEKNEHIFFLPTPDGLLLEECEIQQILSELAKGIFFYNNVPFLSLHFNRDLIQYPVIHPCYQDTLVGHIISMLDYYMKGFCNGFYYEESFVREWEAKPNIDKKFLKNKCINLQEYCQKHLHTSYLTLTQIYKQLESELPTPSAINYELIPRSFRLIAKQDTIKRAENLFLIGGDFDVFYSLDSGQHALMDPFQRQMEEKACEMMCEQIRKIMPELPVFKKYFQALALINFFTYYYTTLKEFDKIPALIPKGSWEELGLNR